MKKKNTTKDSKSPESSIEEVSPVANQVQKASFEIHQYMHNQLLNSVTSHVCEFIMWVSLYITIVGIQTDGDPCIREGAYWGVRGRIKHTNLMRGDHSMLLLLLPRDPEMYASRDDSKPSCVCN